MAIASVFITYRVNFFSDNRHSGVYIVFWIGSKISNTFGSKFYFSAGGNGEGSDMSLFLNLM